MLFAQQRSWCKYGDLFARADGLERGAQRDFRFSNPTSPHSSRSIGYVASMSLLSAAMAVSWSGVSGYGKASSKAACHSVSGP